MTITGGCRCGAVRYRIEAEPLFTRHCWCRDCQYISAGAGTVNVFFPSEPVKVEGAHADEVTPRFRLSEHRRPAGGAEVPVHHVAALGRARIVGERAFDRYRFAWEEHVHRASARADILAVSAPAMPGE